MIVFDYAPFANIGDKYFKSLNETYKYTKIEIKNAIYDEFKMDESTEIPNTSDKKQWDYNTVILAHFNETLEAGNLGLQGIPINHLKIKRRKKENLVFEDIHIFDYDPNIQNYEFKDRFIESYEDYVYGIQPMGGSVENPVLGETTINDVESEFESIWLVGKDAQYQLKYNLEVGSYEYNIPNEIHEMLGKQYPIVSSHGNLRYRKGMLKCMIVSEQSMYGNISPKEEKKLRKSIINFLVDKKPKYFKDGSGESMVISIIGTPTLSPINELNQLIYEMSVDFVEISDIDIQSLIDAGLLEV